MNRQEFKDSLEGAAYVRLEPLAKEIERLDALSLSDDVQVATVGQQV